MKYLNHILTRKKMFFMHITELQKKLIIAITYALPQLLEIASIYIPHIYR